MDQQKIIIGLLGMMLVTYLPRVLPVWYLAGRQLPRAVEVWLRYVPPAVLAAMLLPGLLMPDGTLQINFTNLFLLAAVPAFIIAWKTRPDRYGSGGPGASAGLGIITSTWLVQALMNY